MSFFTIINVIAFSFQQVSAIDGKHQDLVNRKNLIVTLLKKCSPYSFTLSILSIFIFIQNENLYQIVLASLILSYLTFTLSGIIGLVQRRNKVLNWQAIILLDSIFRLLIVAMLTLFKNSAITYVFGLVISSLLAITVSLFLLPLKYLSISAKMREFAPRQVAIIGTFVLLLQSDIFMSQRLNKNDQFNDYILISSSLKLIIGIGMLYAQATLINLKRVKSLKVEFFIIEELKYYIKILICGIVGIIILLTQKDIIGSLITLILNQKIAIDTYIGVNLIVAHIFILSSFYFVLSNLKSNGQTYMMSVFSIALFYFFGNGTNSPTDLAKLFMFVSVLNFTLCKILNVYQFKKK